MKTEGRFVKNYAKMVRLALRQLIRATQRVEFGGPSIVDKKPKAGVPGIGSMQELKHNYSVILFGLSVFLLDSTFLSSSAVPLQQSGTKPKQVIKKITETSY